MLTVDAGVTLPQLARTPQQLIHWERILPLYAELQRQLSGRVSELLALGAPDRRFGPLLSAATATRVGAPR